MFSQVSSIKTTLSKLEDELLFALLDVVLDIEGELLIGSDPIHIPIRRLYVRYEILCPPGGMVGGIDRYCDLRAKALLFLKNRSYIESVDFLQGGTHRWDTQVEISVSDANKISELLTELRIEENRRYPAEKMESDIHTATVRLIKLAESFHRVALKLRVRHDNRTPLLINDEYDVQDLFGALLETEFSDIRREDWAPSYAGRATRVDFFLKNEGVLFETKMTRDRLNDGALGNELIIDVERYKKYPGCNALVCFVYDPEHRLKNPSGLENDLSKKSDHLEVKVLIRPKA